MFPLESMIDNLKLPVGVLVLCSPNARKTRLFGDVNYASEKLNRKLETIISSINKDQVLPDNFLRESVKDIPSNQTFVFACTEISMQADFEGLTGIDTLKILIQRIVKEL